MAQRERRKSGLGELSPAQPLASTEVASTAVAAPAISAPAAVPVTAPTVAPAREVAAPAVGEQQAAPSENGRVKKPKTPKTSFYQDPDDGMRMRGAFLATKYVEGHDNLSEFINEAVMEKVQALEEKHNGGQPFRPMPPGGIGLGKPVKI